FLAQPAADSFHLLPDVSCCRSLEAQVERARGPFGLSACHARLQKSLFFSVWRTRVRPGTVVQSQGPVLTRSAIAGTAIPRLEKSPARQPGEQVLGIFSMSLTLNS